MCRAQRQKQVGDPEPARSPCVTISHDKGFRAPCSASRELGLQQPSLSQPLTVLRDAGRVTARRDGKTIFYRLTDGRGLPILDARTGARVDLEPQPGAYTAAEHR